MSNIRIVRAAMFSLAASLLASGGEAREEPDKKIVRVDHLISLLASKNSAPPIRGDGERDDRTIVFPKEYDPALQVPVYLAVRALCDEGEVGLDRLLLHENDDRYSFSLNSWQDENLSVSDVCRKIARHILCPHDSELRPISRGQTALYPDLKPDETLASWWREHRKRGLPALQLEALATTIRFMEKADRHTVATIHPDAPPLPAREFRRDRAFNLRLLRRIRSQILETDEPYRSPLVFDPTESFFGLPWGGREHNR